MLLAAAVGWVCLGLTGTVAAQPGSLDGAFYPGSVTDGPVYALALQADGSLLIAGDFTIADNGVRGCVARLHADGFLDWSFGAGQAGADAVVRAIAVQADGKVLIGGDFHHVNNTARDWFARLNPDGSLDTNFVTSSGGTVYAIAIQSDGKILMGGNFSSVNGIARRGIARLNTDGTLDGSFTNSLVYPATIYSMAVQTNGQVLLGGNFSKVGGLARTNIARVLANGAVDASFGAGQEGANGTVYSIAVQDDGKVLAGGTFTSVNGTTQMGLARLNTDGSLNFGFNHPFNYAFSAVGALAVNTNAQVLVLGHLVTSNFQAHALARLESNGSLDGAFGYLDLSDARAMALQRDGKPVVAGGFYSVKGEVKLRVARLNTDGTVDATFNTRPTGPGGWVGAVAVADNHRVLIDCGPQTVEGVRPNGIARLNEDGSFDSSFVEYPGAFAGTTSIAVQNDKKIIVAGTFASVVNGLIRNNIARLLPDGQLDTTFDSTAFGNSINAVAVQDDGKIVAGGAFGRGILRLNSDGSVDPSFVVTNSSAAWVDCLAVQSDHKVVIGGTFTQVGATPRNYIARLNSDGSLDTGFGQGLSGANSYVECVAVQSDGKVLLGGYFHTVNGSTRNHIARLNSDGSLDTNFGDGLAGADGIVEAIAVQPDGKILIGGQFNGVNGAPRNHFARLNVDGSLDTALTDNGVNSDVLSIAVAGDGKIVLGGSFTAIGILGQRYVARLYGDQPPLWLARSVPDGVQLSWPAGWDGFTAEQSPALGSLWSEVQPPASNDGTNWSITLPATNTCRFFRLKK